MYLLLTIIFLFTLTCRPPGSDVLLPHFGPLQFTRYLPLPLVKTSFTVTNAYVLRKLRLILFPWRHKPWARRSARGSGDVGVGGGGPQMGGVGGGGEGWLPPRDDINAPDLYIPSEYLSYRPAACRSR